MCREEVWPKDLTNIPRWWCQEICVCVVTALVKILDYPVGTQHTEVMVMPNNEVRLITNINWSVFYFKYVRSLSEISWNRSFLSDS